MIRFMADTWLEAMLRPVSMSVPLGGVYVETMAPDLRFVFALALAIAWLVLLLRTRRGGRRGLVALLVFCITSFVPWMASSGNGRYFIATLLLVGPLCIALLHQLPLTRAARAAGAFLMLGSQAFLAHEVVPWHSWGLVAWKEPPAFSIDVPPDLARQPATFVAINSISYSLIAPAFHPQSRWMSLASQQGTPADPRDTQRVRELLAQSPVIYVIFPSLPGQPITDGHLPEAHARSVDTALVPHGLQLRTGQACRILGSRGLTAVGFPPNEPVPTAPDAQRGFWLCDADNTPAQAAESTALDVRIEAVFNRIENLCPRMFPPGSAKSQVLATGVRRYYADSDMRLYVDGGGDVMYKYIRTLNAVTLGKVQDVLADGFRMDCNNIRGRSGLPWDREI